MQMFVVWPADNPVRYSIARIDRIVSFRSLALCACVGFRHVSGTFGARLD